MLVRAVLFFHSCLKHANRLLLMRGLISPVTAAADLAAVISTEFCRACQQQAAHVQTLGNLILHRCAVLWSLCNRFEGWRALSAEDVRWECLNTHRLRTAWITFVWDGCTRIIPHCLSLASSQRSAAVCPIQGKPAWGKVALINERCAQGHLSSDGNARKRTPRLR